MRKGNGKKVIEREEKEKKVIEWEKETEKSDWLRKGKGKKWLTEKRKRKTVIEREEEKEIKVIEREWGRERFKKIYIMKGFAILAMSRIMVIKKSNISLLNEISMI